MCGIGGIALFPKDRSAAELTYIRLLAKNIANENEWRGRDSTGFATFGNRGIGLFKHPLPASKITETNEFKSFIGKNISNSTRNVLIHTRAGTKGSEKNNLNNHPIESARYVGIHNGIIYNDDELFSSLKLHRAAQVDSEIIFRLLDTVGDKPDTNGLVWVAEKLQGAFTTAFVPKKERNKLFMIRNDNPVTLVYIKPLNIIAFASQMQFLVDAIKDVDKELSTKIDQIDDCLWKEPTRQTILSFDTHYDNAVDQIQQEPHKFTENWSYSNQTWNGYGYDEEFFFRQDEGGIAAKQKEQVSKGFEIGHVLIKMSEEELEEVERYLEIKTTEAWMEGWSQGRESLGEEMEHKVGVSYEEGYDKGFADGFYDGSEMREEENELKASEEEVSISV